MGVSILAIVVSAVASMVVGSIWYGPLFGKMFQREMGMDQWSPEKQAEEKKKMGKLYGMQFAASIVMFYVLAAFVAKQGGMDVQTGITVAFWAWLGFVVPTKFGDALWGGNMRLFWLGIGNMLVTLLVAGAIVGAWG